MEADRHKSKALQNSGPSARLYLFHKAGDVALVQLFQGLGLRNQEHSAWRCGSWVPSLWEPFCRHAHADVPPGQCINAAQFTLLRAPLESQA